MEPKEPKPCRWCHIVPQKKTDTYSPIDEERMTYYKVECPQCHARTWSALSMKIAVEMWNQTYGYSADGGKYGKH